MSLLDYSGFSKAGQLGYEPEINKFSDALTEIVRDRETRRKNDAEAAWHIDEVKQRREHDAMETEKNRLSRQDALRTAAEEQRRHDRQASIDATKALMDAARSGDPDAMAAMASAYGVPPERGTGGQTPQPSPEDALQLRLRPPSLGDSAPRALPPEVSAIARRYEAPAGGGQEPIPLAGTSARPDEVPLWTAGPGPSAIPNYEAPLASNIPVGAEVDRISQDVANVGRGSAPPPSASTRLFNPSAQGFQGAADPSAPPAQSPARQSYRLPSGETISLNPNAGRDARKRVADEFRQAQGARLDSVFQSAAGRPPEVQAKIRAQVQQEREDVERLALGLESGTLEKTAAGTQLGEGVRQRSGQDAASDLETRRETAAMARTQVMAGAAAARQAATRPPAGEPDPKVLTGYDRSVAEVKANSLTKKDLEEARLFDRLSAELRDPNGHQGQLALDTLTRIAVGGRAPVLLEQNLQYAMGLLSGTENRIYRETHEGRNMPEVNNALRKALNDARAVSLAQRQTDAAAAEEKIGLSSTWAGVPEIQSRVIDNMRAYYRQLGLPIPKQYERAPPAPRPAAAPARPMSEQSDEEFLNGQ